MNAKGSYLKAVRGSAEFIEYQQAWRNWRNSQFGSPDAEKEILKEKLRAYAKKMVAEIKPEHMRHGYAFDPTKVRSQTLVRLAMTENAHIAKYISGVLGGGFAYVISKNPLLSGAAGTVIGTTVADILSDPRVKRLISRGRERLLSQTAFVTSDAAGTFVKAGYKSSQAYARGGEQ